MTLRVVLLGAGFAIALSLALVRGPAIAAQIPPFARAPLDVRESSRYVRAVLAPGSADTIPLYTEEQLTRGTALYGKVCAECHENSDYTSEKFRAKWNGKSVYELYETIRTKMPDDRPGTLTRDEYAEALAYILKINGVPAGPHSVAPDSAAMTAATLSLGAPPPLPPSPSLSR